MNISLRWIYDFFNIYEIFTASRINFCKYGKQKVNLQVIVNYHTYYKDKWQKIIQCRIDFSAEVCQSYDNYISSDFANEYGGTQVKLK